MGTDEFAEHGVLDAQVERVDQPVPINERPGGFTIRHEEHLGRAGQGLADQRKHLQDGVVERIQSFGERRFAERHRCGHMPSLGRDW